MVIKATVGSRDQAAIKTIRRDAGLARANEQNAVTARIERKSDSPFTVADTETQFLHVTVPRSLQRVRKGTAEGWPEKLQRRDRGRRRFLDIVTPLSKFRGEFIVELDGPDHAGI